MTRYLVDGVSLSPEEEARHKGAVNAALNGIMSQPRASLQDNHEAVVQSAFDKGDQAVREFRRRIQDQHRPVEPPPRAPHRMIGGEAIVTRWVENDLLLTIPRNLAIGKLKQLTYPLSLKQIAEEAELRHDMVRDLVAAKILVEAEEGANGR